MSADWPPEPPRRIRMLRGYLKRPDFKGVWLGRQEVSELLAYFDELAAAGKGG